MRRILIGLVAVLFCGLAWGAPTGSVLKAEGNIEGGALTDKELWFTLDWGDLKFTVDRSAAPQVEAMFQAISDAAKENRSITVWYDPDTAAIDREKWLPVFAVRKVLIAGKTIVGDEKTPPHALAATASPVEQAEDALAHGMALNNAGQPKAALPLLDRALGEAGLAVQLRVLALKARAGLREDAGLTDFAPGEARDRALMAALEDARTWQKAAPDEVRATFQVARLLGYLGAYDEAIAIYKDGLLRWPNETDRVYRGLEQVYRDMGKLGDAAQWLDKFASLPGGKDTMPYHYHRGWLYDLMGLSEAAIAEYNEGMKIQPDYAGAFWRRSCSYAAVGHIKEAYDDFQVFKTKHESFMAGVAPTLAEEADAKETAAVAEILKKALAEDPHRKLPGLCDGFWDWGDKPRTRSLLLPVTR